MIKAYSTIGGARRASPQGPILRLLDDPEELFVVGLSGNGSVMAIDPATGRADGTVKVLDLMAGSLVASPPVEAGDDQRQGVTEAVHAVLDELDSSRAAWRRPGAPDFQRQLGLASHLVTNARSGDLTSRRREAVAAVARLLDAIEKIDEELAR